MTSKREWFAAMALQGLLSNMTTITPLASISIQIVVENAVRTADEMIRVLSASDGDK